MRRALLLTVALLALGARADAPDDGAALLRAIDTAIGTPRCERDAQCRTVAIGARACGGPEAYRAHALEGKAADQLALLAEQHRQTRQAWQQRSGRAGICQFLADPGARCVAQRCELLSPPP